MKSIEEEQQFKTLEAAKAGNEEAFGQLIDPHRRELLVHRYRILGSFEHAEGQCRRRLCTCLETSRCV